MSTQAARQLLEPEPMFSHIDFTLPAQGALAAAERIGEACRAAWDAYDKPASAQAIPTAIPDLCKTWTPTQRYHWRIGFYSPAPKPQPTP